jgi:hypothetical protein
VYEPCNFDKAHRFLIAGQKPRNQNYIYGLQAVRKAYEERGEEKLDELLLVSGGSDAICALSKGYLAVWLDSEVKGLSEADYWLLMKYCHRLVSVPDIDDTGVKCGCRQALIHLGIYTAWLNTNDMGGLHDNRGRQCKDLRDYCRLNPSRKAMNQLVGRAVRAQFWTEHTTKSGQKEYSLSLTSLNYLLELKRRGIPAFLISGVVSERSALLKWYGRLFYADALKAYRAMMVLDEDSQHRLQDYTSAER